MNIDVNYLVQKICDMSGVPIRIYEKDTPISLFTVVPLIRDPFILYAADVLPSPLPVGYYLTEEFDYYCFLRFDKDRTMIIGPSRLTDRSEQKIRDLAFRLNIGNDDYDDFRNAMRAFTNMPLDSLLQILSTMYYVLHGKKIELEDIKIVASDLKDISTSFDWRDVNSRIYPTDEVHGSDRYKTYQVEQLLCEYVRHGDVNGFLKWAEAAPSLRAPVLSGDYLRHLKNTLIVSATVFSRAAIRGGMDIDEATRLCDDYILKCDDARDPRQIIEFQYHMIRTFAEKVRKIRLERIDSEIKRNVYTYIQKHLSEPIHTTEIADSLYMSRSHLSTSFRQTTGIHLNDYIHIVKISEAKHLLSHSDKSILLISNYLGYSSQSYFCNVFKKYTGLTPKEFQSRNT